MKLNRAIPLDPFPIPIRVATWAPSFISCPNSRVVEHFQLEGVTRSFHLGPDLRMKNLPDS